MSQFVSVAQRQAFSAEKMRKQNLFDSPNMFCDVYCFEPGQSQSAHTHAGSDKIYYVLEGTAEIQIGDQTGRCGPGTAAHAGPGVAHAVSNPGPERLTVLVFMAPKPS